MNPNASRGVHFGRARVVLTRIAMGVCAVVILGAASYVAPARRELETETLNG